MKDEAIDDIKTDGLDIDKMTDEQIDKGIEDGFGEKEKETPAESSTEKETEQETSPASEGEEGGQPSNTPDEDKPVPFHKHPRFKEVISEKNELKDEVNVLKGRLDERETMQGEQPKPVPAWFSKLYGDDNEAWQAYSQANAVERKSMKDEILTEIRTDQQTQTEVQQKTDKEANDYVDSSLEALKADGKKFDKNGLLKVMKEYPTTDSSGNLDFNKGFQLYEKLTEAKKDPEKDKARKELADKTTPESKPEGKEKPFGTSVNLRNRSFTSLAAGKD